MRMAKNCLSLIVLLPFNLLGDLPASPQEMLATMTLKEKIGQCIMVAAVSNELLNKDFMAISPYQMGIVHVSGLITQHHVGGVIFLGSGNIAEQKAVTDYFQSLAGTPLMIAMDAEWGLSMRLKDAPRFPHNMTLGAITDDTLTYQMGYLVGRQCKQIGVHLNLAPVMDVNNNPNNPVINDRSFGSDPQRVAQKGIAFANGMRDAGIIACAKHFPGHGDTDVDSHLALPVIMHDRARLDQIELYPFRAIIDNGIAAVMTAHLQVPTLEPDGITPATLSKKITTDLLRHELGFDGLIITDGLGMKGVTDFYTSGQMEVHALKAGADVLLAPVDVPNAIAAIEQAVMSGEISEQELDQHVLRILRAKEWTLNANSNHPDCPDHKELKKNLYYQAVTMVKDTLNPKRDKSQDMIIEITNMNKYKQLQFGIQDKTLQTIKKLKQSGHAVTVVLYGSPYALDLVQDADRIIVAYEDDADAHIGVAQVLAGNPALGILPV